MTISSPSAFEQMVTLQLLNQQEREKGDSSSEEDERPLRPSQEQSASATSGLCSPPANAEGQEATVVLSEQVVEEVTPSPPQAPPTPEDSVESRKGQPDAEVLSEIEDDFLPPKPAYTPSHRVLGPPTSIPPKPPGPVPVNSECEETPVAGPVAARSDNAAGSVHAGAAPDGSPQETSRRSSLTPGPEKGDPPALGPESPGKPQPPELSENEDVTSPAGPSEEPLGMEASSAAAGPALRPSHSSQCSRYVPLSSVRDRMATNGGSVCFFQGCQFIPQTLASLLIHSYIYSTTLTMYRARCWARG